VLVSKLDDYNFAEWSTNALESKRDVMAWPRNYFKYKIGNEVG